MYKSAVVFSVVFSACSVLGGVYDDVSYWFRGCCNGLVDANARLDNYEFPNALTIGAGRNPSGDSFTLAGGARVNLQIETLDVVQPFAGGMLKGRESLHFVQPDAVEDDVVVHKATCFTMTGPFSFQKSNSFSVCLRFKRESPVDADNTWCQLFSSDYSWSGNCGFRIAFEDVSAGGYNVEIWLGASQKKKFGNIVLPYGKWVDLAVTVKGAKETGGRSNTAVYACPEGGALQSQMIAIYYESEKAFYNDKQMYVGGYGSDSCEKYFRGWLQQMGIWNRCLSADEVREAFSDNLQSGDLWRLGVANDSADDFSGTNYVGKVRPEFTVAAAQTDYRFVSRVLNAESDSASVSFELDPAVAVTKRRLSLKTTSGSADGDIKVTVNGHDCATATVKAGETAVFDIPAHVFRSGGNLVKLSRTDSAAGDVGLDQMALSVGIATVRSPSPVADDVYADAHCWFRGPVDRDGNGYLAVPSDASSQETYEYPDVFHRSVPDDAFNGIGVRGVWSNVLVTAQDVTLPSRGVALQDEPCIYLAQWTGVDAEGNAVAMGGGLAKSLFPATNASSYSVVMRFKMDSFTSSDNAAELFGFGFQHGLRTGVAFALKGEPDNMHVNTFFGASGHDFKETTTGDESVRLAAGKWIDIALVVSNGYARVCSCPEGGAFLSQAPVKLNAGSSFGSESYSSMLHIGTQSGAFEVSPSASGSFRKFRGWIHQVAVWPRALTDAEVKDAFSWPSPDLVRMGAADGTGGELCGGMTNCWNASANGDLSLAPSSIPPSGSSLEVKFEVPEQESPYAQLLKIALTAESPGNAAVAVSVNGGRIVNYDEDYRPFREFDLLPGGVCEIGIPRGTLKTGLNSVVITRTDGTVFPALIDALSIGRHGRIVRVRVSGCTIVVR